MDNNITVLGDSFPLAKINLSQNENMFLQSGAMVYKDTGIKLKARLNAEGSGITKFIKAVGRSMASGENIFITEAIAERPGVIALAPPVPGKIGILKCGQNQYRLNDGAFLALDGSARYKMKRQTLGKAIFSKSGGLFVMETEGEGNLLINAFGNIETIELHGDSITIDNGHVLAWDKNLDYNIHMETGFWDSIGTGEGLVNTFTGHGKIYIQTLNLESFASVLQPKIVGTGSSSSSSSVNLIDTIF